MMIKMQSGGKTKVSITVGDLCETCGKTCKRKKTFFFSSFSQKTGNWTAAKLLFTSIPQNLKCSITVHPEQNKTFSVNYIKSMLLKMKCRSRKCCTTAVCSFTINIVI